MKPTKGRIVNYVCNNVIQPAIITNVFSDTCVNLIIFLDGRVDFATSVVLHDPSSGENKSGTWHWPTLAQNKQG